VGTVDLGTHVYVKEFIKIVGEVCVLEIFISLRILPSGIV
jgi:hypothetical protein